MNAIRSIISVFLVALMAVSIAGWVWAGDQPTPTQVGARVVLAMCGLSSVGALALIWSVKRPAPAE
jgi:hypothetical protein